MRLLLSLTIASLMVFQANANTTTAPVKPGQPRFERYVVKTKQSKKAKQANQKQEAVAAVAVEMAPTLQLNAQLAGQTAIFQINAAPLNYNATAELINSFGEVLLTEIVVAGAENILSFDLSHLPQDTYYLRIDGETSLLSAGIERM